MPNGDPDFADKTLPELEAFFAPFSAACRQFADQHNIRIEKYYHEFSAWSFLFRHPAGGIGKIDLVRKSESQLKIWEYWWHDDYDKATRSLKTKEHEPFDFEDIDLVEMLNSALSDILDWKYGEWDSVHSGYESSWHGTFTKKQFEALGEDYPVLKK